MKKLLLTAALILALGAAFGQTIKNGSVLAIHEFIPVLQPDVTMNQVNDVFIHKWIPAWEKAYPGMKVFALKGDRGEYAHYTGNIFYFESRALRNKYWPDESGAGPFDEAASKILGPLQEEWSKLVIGSKGTATDWVVLPVNTSAPAPLKKGVVLGTHLLTINLDPDVTMNQYLDYLTKKYIPAMEKEFQGWRFFMLRGERNDYKNRYMFLVWVESLETRDKYLDKDGGFNDLGRAAMLKLQPLTDQLGKLGTYTSVFTDWIIQ